MPVWEGTKEGQQRPEGHVVRLNELVRFDPSTTRNAELEAEEQLQDDFSLYCQVTDYNARVMLHSIHYYFVRLQEIKGGTFCWNEAINGVKKAFQTVAVEEHKVKSPNLKPDSYRRFGSRIAKIRIDALIKELKVLKEKYELDYNNGLRSGYNVRDIEFINNVEMSIFPEKWAEHCKIFTDINNRKKENRRSYENCQITASNSKKRSHLASDCSEVASVSKKVKKDEGKEEGEEETDNGEESDYEGGKDESEDDEDEEEESDQKNKKSTIKAAKNKIDRGGEIGVEKTSNKDDLTDEDEKESSKGVEHDLTDEDEKESSRVVEKDEHEENKKDTVKGEGKEEGEEEKEPNGEESDDEKEVEESDENAEDHNVNISHFSTSFLQAVVRSEGNTKVPAQFYTDNKEKVIRLFNHNNKDGDIPPDLSKSKVLSDEICKFRYSGAEEEKLFDAFRGLASPGMMRDIAEEREKNEKAINIVDDDPPVNYVSIATKNFDGLILNRSNKLIDSEFESQMIGLLKSIRAITVFNGQVALKLNANTADSTILNIVTDVISGNNESQLMKSCMFDCKYDVYLEYDAHDDKIPGNGLCGATSLYFNKEQRILDFNKVEDLETMKLFYSELFELHRNSSDISERDKMQFTKQETLDCMLRMMDANIAHLKGKIFTPVHGANKPNWYPKDCDGWLTQFQLPLYSDGTIATTLLVSDRDNSLEGPVANSTYAKIDSTNVLFPKFVFHRFFHEYEMILRESENALIVFTGNHFFNLNRQTPKEYLKAYRDSFSKFMSDVREKVVKLFGKTALSPTLVANIRDRLEVGKIALAVLSRTYSSKSS